VCHVTCSAELQISDLKTISLELRRRNMQMGTDKLFFSTLTVHKKIHKLTHVPTDFNNHMVQFIFECTVMCR